MIRDWSSEQRMLVFPTTYGYTVRYSYFLEHIWQPLLAKAGLCYRSYHATRACSMYLKYAVLFTCPRASMSPQWICTRSMWAGRRSVMAGE